MKIKLKNTKEQVELIKALASSDKLKSMAAQEAFAAFVAPIVEMVLSQAGTASLIYTDVPFDEDDSPSIPLDLYFGTNAGNINVWAQNMPGGLASSQVQGMQEMKFTTYQLDSAVSFLKKYAKRSRLDVVSKALERMAQEVLVKQERNAWSPLLSALAASTTNTGAANQQHVIRCTTAGVLQVDDINKLFTLIKRINTSFAFGTPSNTISNGLTDYLVSPEVKEQIRGFAYNAINTRGGAGVTATNATGVVSAPEAIREKIFSNSGNQEIFGVSIHELNELGVGQKYTTLFGTVAGATNYTTLAGTGSATFATTSDITVGLDLTRESFLRPVSEQSDSKGTFMVMPDDQFLARAEKIGFWGKLEEGRVVVDSRSCVGLIIT